MIKSMPILLILVSVTPGLAQPKAPAFEAASIKPSKATDNGSGWHTRPGYLVINNQTLKGLVAIAYSVPDGRVSGGPKWIEFDRFNVEARAEGPAKEPELLLMLRSMLAERFQLAVHPDTRSAPGFALTLAKNGLKIHPDETEVQPGWNSSQGSQGKIVAQRISMAKVADSLTRMLGTPVVDATNTKGLFTFTLEWTPETARPAAAPDSVLPDAPAGPSLFTVLQQQLGVKLESEKLPVEVVVIDKAEKPTEN